MPITRRFWHRQPAIDAALVQRFADFIGPDKLVVDIGAGYAPWPHAIEFVDYKAWPQLAGRTVRVVDIENEPLPYADKSVDFAYCRHTIEDLDHPSLLLREINRIAKAGYIETPSPIAEFCRGIDGGYPGRGYCHHRWFVWVAGSELRLLPKFPDVEHIATAPGADVRLIETLNFSPAHWNTYFAWIGEFSFRVLKQHRDFPFPQYHEHIDEGIKSASETLATS